MNTDIRISVDFLDHPKTVKLEKRLGVSGIKALLSLWMWAAKNRPDGDFSEMDGEDIEIAARWQGTDGELLDTLVALRWVDKTDAGYLIHDWDEHNAWAADACDRSAKARLGKLAQVNKAGFMECQRLGIESLSQSEYKKWKNWRRANAEQQNGECTANAGDSLAPSPSPSPSPAPTHEEISQGTKVPLSAETADEGGDVANGDSTLSLLKPEEAKQADPFEQVVAMYNRLLVDEQPKERKLPRCTLLTDKRKAAIKARFKQLTTLDAWEEYFRRVGRCPWLMGEKSAEWRAAFDWLLMVSNFLKVWEGNFLPDTEKAAAKKLPLLSKALDFVSRHVSAGEDAAAMVALFCQHNRLDVAEYEPAVLAAVGTAVQPVQA